MTESPVATVVIVNWNGAHLLPACLDGLARQRTDAPPFETVVVDNASVDESRALVSAEYPWVRLIANEANLGFAGGNNVALRDITSPYTVLLNNDAVPQPGWLRELLGAFELPGNHDVAMVTGKVLFMPRFAWIRLRTPVFRPTSSDTRELGVQVHGVSVDGVDVTDRVLWEQAAYGPEAAGANRFRWTHPHGAFLLPLPETAAAGDVLDRDVVLDVTVSAERTKALTLSVDGHEVNADVGPERRTVALTIKRGTEVLDVVNNAGGIVLRDGSGADRGFQEIDTGQFAEALEVFTGCGNGMAMRTSVGHELGWFDDVFFTYYEDTDLSWRWRSRGWSIRYVPSAVLRHIHSATSGEWSPRWTFYVDRNRLLMLVKNGSAPLARRAVTQYVRDTVMSGLQAAASLRTGNVRGRFRLPLARLRVLRSFGRQLPHAWYQRRHVRRNATVSTHELERWLVDR